MGYDFTWILRRSACSRLGTRTEQHAVRELRLDVVGVDLLRQAYAVLEASDAAGALAEDALASRSFSSPVIISSFEISSMLTSSFATPGSSASIT